jgi:hypothetical protein
MIDINSFINIIVRMVLTPTSQEVAVSYLTHRSKLPQLMAQLQERGLLRHQGKTKSPAKWLVAVSSVSEPTIRKALDPRTADQVDAGTLWNLYLGMREARITVVDKRSERPVIFEGDVVEVVEAED